MKTKSVSKSGFFHPRALIGFGFGAIGLLLGLVAFIALPKHSAFAPPLGCTDVVFEETPGPSCSIIVTIESHGQSAPFTPCTIYYTIGTTVPPDPTHSSANGTSPVAINVGAGQLRRIKAFGHRTSAIPEDTAIAGPYIANNTCPCCRPAGGASD
jgi:hypothetical protein